MDIHALILKVMPHFHEIRRDIYLLRHENPGKTAGELSHTYMARARNKYASVGVATALPGILPGLGTAAQIALETGAISADVVFMLRWMASVCYGTGLIYGKDTEAGFEAEFTLVLGIWAGVVVPGKTAMAKGEKLTIGHFDKHITDRIRNRMNQKIGRKLVTKYGSKRSGAALGRLIPFGIGAIVGGTFNYITLQRFGKAADDYFSASGEDYIIEA
jgi:hypothetical protein